jgi:hypothetical protein
LALLGGRVDALGRMIFQTLGGTILGYGVMAWFLRDLNDRSIRRGVMAGVAISYAIVAVVVGSAAASGLLNLLAWPIVALHGAVAIGLAVLWFTAVSVGRSDSN